MPVNNISLLPDELKAKEAEARTKASEIKPPLSFKMHLPESQKIDSVSVAATNQNPTVSFGNGSKTEEKKGVFQIVKKTEPPKPPVAPPPPAPPKPKLKPDMWLKYFEPAKGILKKIKPLYLNSKNTNPEYEWVIKSEYWYKLRALMLISLIIIIAVSAGWVGIKYYN